MTLTAACASSAASVIPLHSTGKERDTETGNDDFGARYYASSMGRWLSPDWSAKYEPVPYAQMGDPQTLNLYSYVRNSPLSAVDLDGHDGCAIGGIGVSCGDLSSEGAVEYNESEQQADQMIGAQEARDKAKADANLEKRQQLADAAYDEAQSHDKAYAQGKRST